MNYLMNDFIHTGYWAKTLTTIEDPNLQVIEVDNGHNWEIKFYVGNNLIDYINLEMRNGTQLNSGVLELSVYDEDSKRLGSLAERLENAYNVNGYDNSIIQPRG